MRLLSRRPLAVVPAVVALWAGGCNQLSGLSGYKKDIPCSVNAECVGIGQGSWQKYVCRKDVGRCVELTSPECPEVEGDYANDEAFVFASLLPTTNEAGEAGAGRPLLNAMRLALGDFAINVNDLPPRPGSSARRPLVMLACDDRGNVEVSKRAAAHVIDEVGLPAILGPMFSGIAVRVANEVVIPGGRTFMLSPTAAATSLTGLDDGGLVWRLAPSTDVQVQALARFMGVVENDPGVRAMLRVDGATRGAVRVAALSKGDAFGDSLAAGLRGQLKFNGQSAIEQTNSGNFSEHKYGNPDDPAVPPPEYNRAVDDLIARRPHFVFLLGVEEINTELLPRIEERWGDEAPRPFYLAASGPYAPSLFNFVRASDRAWRLRERILGVVPGSNDEVFLKFRSSYGGAYDSSEADTSGPSHAYDAVYLLAFGAAALGNEPITGPNLALSMGRLVAPDGVPFAADPLKLSDPLNLLVGGGSINFKGASGQIDFDLTTGDLKASQMQIWCINLESKGQYSSAYYNTDGNLVQTTSEIRATCKFEQGVGARVASPPALGGPAARSGLEAR